MGEAFFSLESKPLDLKYADILPGVRGEFRIGELPGELSETHNF